MKKILSARDMKKVDEYSINIIGIPSLALMETASRYVAKYIEKRHDTDAKIVAVCGVGNNGADGVAAVRTLFSRGYKQLEVIVVGDIKKATREFKVQLEVIKKLEIKCITDEKDIQQQKFDSYDVIVDGLFGIGLSREVTGIFSEVISKINSSKCKKYAIDIPSGIDGNTGRVLGNAIKADYTITFGSLKLGQVLYPGADYAGEIEVFDIGFPKEAYSNADIIYTLENSDLTKLFPKRKDYSNKGTYGKLLIIAGNEDMYGAAYMSAMASFYMGVGLIKILTTENNKPIINEKLPEAIVVAIDDSNVRDILNTEISWCDTMLIGPGMGVSKRTEEILGICLDAGKKTIIDADGINALSASEALKGKLHNQVIITPHLGEMSRFIKKSIKEIADNMVESCRMASKKYGISVVMKDTRSIITNALLETYINMNGNSGMAKAGSGDVLAGIISGITATGVEINNAACVGAYIHGLAGSLAREEYGEYSMMPTDMIKSLKRVNEIV